MAEKREPTFASAETESVAGGQAPGNGTQAEANIDAAKLTAELETVKRQAAENLDKFVRARADMENARRRAEIDIANAHKYGIERFALELLPVRDSLEFARTVDVQENQTALQKMHEGLDLTLKLLDDAFRKFSLVALDPKGEKFDPAKHHAISMVESQEVPPNHVVSVMQKGYMLHDRIVRPAMVVVARAPAAPTTDSST